MRTVTLLAMKGGCGKTTTAINLAVAFQRAGKNTVIFDLDPQASASEWHDAREDKLPHVESLQPSRLIKTHEQAKEIGADIVIIDTAPHSEAAALASCRLADLILIPCQPSIMDLRALTKTIDLVKMLTVPAYAVLNGVQHHSTGAARQAEKTIEETLKLPMCPVRIGERVIYSRAPITGQTPQEVEPEGKAANEIKRLMKWTATMLGEKL